VKNRDLKKRLDRNRRMTVTSSQTELIVVSSRDRFRQLASELPTCQDAVLEIGCSTGEATRLLARSGARVVAVDVADEVVAQLQAELAGCGSVTVAPVDGRNTPRLLELLPEPDLIFVDIGGDAQLDNVAFQVRACLRAFAPRLMVVRSFELATLASLITEVEPPEASELRRTSVHDKLGPALENLLDLSRSSSVNNRVFAARKLRSLGTPAARERLQEMADDPHPRVRRIARGGGKKRREDG